MGVTYNINVNEESLFCCSEHWSYGFTTLTDNTTIWLNIRIRKIVYWFNFATVGNIVNI
jgi:hypothetical protein